MPTKTRSILPLFSRRSTVAAVETNAADWRSDVAFEGIPTGDGRFMVPGSLSWRDLPLSLMAMIETAAGHDGAQVAGRMDTFEKLPTDMEGRALPDDAASLFSTGVFDTGAYGQEIGRMVGEETLRGISVDLAVNEWAFRDPDTGELIDPETATDEQWDKAFMGAYEFAVVDGEVMAATVCPTPAFADARIALVATAVSPYAARTWSAGREYAEANGVPEGQMMTTLVAAIRPRAEGVQAAAVVEPVKGLAPLEPPTEWFYRPEPDEPTAMTLLDTGEYFGHIALWESCHIGYLNGQWGQCVTPPRSPSDYADFHRTLLRTKDGADPIDLEVGCMTLGSGHASPSAGRLPAREHYDNEGSVGAYVRAINGKHGIWVCGATRSDLTAEQVRDLRAHPPSGDWRDAGGHLELQAVCTVVVAGFPVPRSQLALAADGDQVRIVTLILTAAAPDCDDCEADFEIQASLLAAAIEGPEALDDLIQAD